MAAMKRHDAREEVFRLLFETEFHAEMSPQEIYGLARQVRDFEDSDYIRKAYFGVLEKREEIDAMIARHANGWRVDRIAPVSRNILRLCVYEMRWQDDVPVLAALNEAIELTKTFDEKKARAFVNGILNGVKTELESGPADRPETAAQEPAE